MNPSSFPLFPYPQGFPPPDLPGVSRPVQTYPYSHIQDSESQTIATQNAFASREAFNSNRNVIPGLSFTATATTGLPLQQTWPQTATATGVVPPIQFQAIAANISNSTSTSPVSARRPDEAVPNINAPHEVVVDPQSDSVEEGELTEGAFEDLYEPEEFSETLDLRRESPRPHPTSQKSMLDPPGDAGKRIGGAGDDEGSDEEGPYSPYLSPRETDSPNQDTIPPQTTTLETITSQNTSASHSTFPPQNGMPVTAKPQTQSLADAKKKAQAAILSLLSLGVRYQNYLDAGINETVVKLLFTDLGLDMGPAKQQQAKEQISQPPVVSVSSRAPEPAVPVAPPAGPSTSSDKSEERKDRIARLLAAKSAKANTSASAPAPATVPSPTQTPSTSVTSTTAPDMSTVSHLPEAPALASKVADPNVNDTTTGQARNKSEKLLILQQKMEALQRSRAERALKASQLATGVKINDANASDVQPDSALPESQPMSQEPQTSHLPHSDSNESAPTPQDRSIPGLFLSFPGPSNSVVNPRKRPVASDFNDAPIAPIPNKRPFGHNRIPQPFIIDVSEDSEDEDVEMEIASQVDDPESTSTLPTASLRDQHPLPDRPRTKSFPGSAPHRGNASASPRQRPVPELDRMARTISEMKRKIAEAERRKKAKQAARASPSTLPTPPAPAVSLVAGADDIPTATPPLESVAQPTADDATESPRSSTSAEENTAVPDQGSMKLPKAGELGAVKDSAGQAERLRITSAQLPNIEAGLRQKAIKLRLLKSEVARLEREVEEDLAEKKRLTAEAIQLKMASTMQTTSSPEARPMVASPSTQGFSDMNMHAGANLPARPASIPSMVLTAGLPKKPPPTGSVSSPDQISSDTTDICVDEAPPAPIPTLDVTPVPNTEFPKQPSIDSNGVEDDNGPDNSGTARAIPTKPEEENIAVASEEPQPAEEPNYTPATSSLHRSPSPSDVEMQAEEEDGDDSTSSVSEEESYQPSIRSPPPDMNPDSYLPRESSQKLSPTLAPETTEMEDADGPESIGMESDAHGDTLVGTVDLIEDDETEANQEASDKENDSDVDDGEQNSPAVFVPYDSPLKYFVSYRLHPMFSHDVSGGLRSLTYSNNINPRVPLCPDDLIGQDGCAKGKDCEFQHLDLTSLNDSEILLQLGSADTLEGETKQRYINGLRELLSNSRDKDIRDFQVISQSIIDYRASFFADPYRILPLGDVSL